MIAEILRTVAVLSALSQSPTEAMIEHTARAMDVSAEYAACIAYHESRFDPDAVGDQGRAVGLYQWHYPSWRHVRRKMGLPTVDRRADPAEATVTAMWAWRNGYADWWSTRPLCIEHADGR